MRRLCLFVASTVLFAAPVALADDELPFEAFVIPAEAEVYSGPAEPRYVTQTIPRGTKVEVYERQDEWLAIRPPEGCFCWVTEASLTMSAEPGVAEATADSVACWIGSSAEKVKEHQSAVHLKKGEPVEVLGKKEVENADGQREVWLKIAPPAGEFRWIHASQVSRQAPPAFSQVAATESDPRSADAWTSSGRRLRKVDPKPSDESDDRQPESPSYNGPFHRSSMELRDLAPPPVRQAAFQQENASSAVQQAGYQTDAESAAPSSRPLSPDGFVARRPRADHARSTTTNRAAPPLLSTSGGLASAAAPAKRTVSTSNSTPPAPAEPTVEVSETKHAGVSSAQVQRKLAEIDVALSLMVSHDRSQWNLAALKREVQQLVEYGATPVDRGEARFMLEKIDRFAQAFGVEDDDSPAALNLPVGSAAARKAALEAAIAPKYDGSGYLTPVRAAKPVAPYALLDQSGNRLCFVTPVPGFNLRAYENRQIGVFGKRGYLPDANAAHLLAERVVDLDKQSR